MKIELDKAQYRSTEPVKVIVFTEIELNESNIHIRKLNQKIIFECKILKQSEGYQIVLSGLQDGNYLIRVEKENEWAETSFDIVESRKNVIRYGFLADFENDEKNTDIECMKQWHINAVQFYDWMFRHDKLVSDSTEYTEPLGRLIKSDVLQSKIDSCLKFGMRPIAYGAVYAATKDTFRIHPEWGLYTMDGESIVFADWLHFMNIARESGWRNHILEEYRQSMEKLGFAGIHMDTYGFPKNVFDSKQRKLDLAEDFAELIDEAAHIAESIDPENGVIFNAVNNWPVEAVAKSRQDAVYIEVWPPNEQYYHLYRLIRDARKMSNKTVVLAAYMKPFKDASSEEKKEAAEFAYLLANAVICASGGTQLALGEFNSILSDSYYVDYSRLRQGFLPVVQKYCDYLVGYADLLYDDDGIDITMTASGGINEDIMFFSEQATFSQTGEAGKIWTIIREQKNRLTVHFINITGNDSYWNEPKERPVVVDDILVKVRYDRKLKTVFYASPDEQSIFPRELSYKMESGNSGRIYEIKIPKVFIWTTLEIEME